MTDQIERIKAALVKFEAIVRKSLGEDERFLKGVYLHKYPGKLLPDKYFLSITMVDGKHGISPDVTSLDCIEDDLGLWIETYSKNPWVEIADRYRKDGYIESCDRGWKEDSTIYMRA